MKKMDSNQPISLKVQFRHMPHSRALHHLVRQQANRLGKFNLGDSRCEVVIDETNHWHEGGVFRVAVRLVIPGERLLVAHFEEESGSPEFIHSAVRSAFDEIERQIKKQRRRSYRRTRIAELAA